MKVLFSLILLPTLSYCQFTGIGIFKIGNTKNIILSEIKASTGISLVLYNGIMEEFKATSKKQDKTVFVTGLVDGKMFPESNINGIKIDPNRQDININFYTVANISLREIKLSFYKDSLMFFACKGSDSLLTALKTKYGTPSIRIEKDTVTCRSKVAGAFDLKEGVYFYTWNIPTDNVQSEFSEGIKYDEKCETDIIHRFTVKDTYKFNTSLEYSIPKTKIEKSTLKDF